MPLVGIVSGHCYAGNAALLGCCDVVIATEDASIGMGGPAMIEGGGLGVFAPEESVRSTSSTPTASSTSRVADEAEAVARGQAIPVATSARGAATAAAAEHDQTGLRDLIPENRKRVYDVRAVIDALLDDVLELAAASGRDGHRPRPRRRPAARG